MEGLAEAWTLAALIGDGTLRAALMATADWPLARLLRRSSTAYIVLNAGHILAIGTLIGSILVLDIRLLGGFRRHPIEALAPPLATTALAGTCAAILTGLALFTVRPDAYLDNAAFAAKLALLILALTNALSLRLSPAWRDVSAFGYVTPPVRIAAALSLLLWPATLLAGRWIGFL